MRRRGLVMICLLAVTAGFSPSAAPEVLPEVGIGIALDGPSPENDFSLLAMAEMRTLLEGEFDVRFEVLEGEWTTASVRSAVDRLLDDDEVDLVVALGALASQIFCCRRDLPKPVIAAVVVDAELQGLPRADGSSGIRNLNYLTFPQSVESDMERFLAITPFENLAIVFNQWFTDNVPGLLDKFGARVEQFGIEPLLVTAGDSVEETVAAIPEEAEAVYVAPLIHFSEKERRLFYQRLVDRRLPSFATLGVIDVGHGALAGQRDVTFFERLARRIALNVQRIVLGEEAGSLPVTIPDRQLLTINMATVRAIDVYPPWEVLAEAELLHEEPEYARTLSLDSVVREAIEVNLDLRARQREVAAGAQEVALARSLRRPRIEVEVTGVAIDDDRVSPLSPQGEATATAGLALTQILYSEALGANVDVERELQRQRQLSYDELRLDVAREAAVAYLDVLRAKTLETVRKNNLRLTRSNLELARVRRSVGTAGPGEVYRWESGLASDRRDLIETQAARFQAQEALNRILHRWQGEGFETEDVGLDDPELITSKERIYSYTVSARHLEVFSNFTIEYGLGRSPELAQVDAVVAAQKRALASARRSFWRPDLGLQASLDHIVETWGEGSDGGGISLFPVPDDTSWSVAVRGSLPLSAGGERAAEVIRAEESLARLELERQALAERVEQRIRSELHQLRASFAGIRLSRQAADAARKNLDLVTDAYTRGAADVLDLLDAQSAALTADLAAATALYQFFIDLIEFERAINRLDFFTSPEEDEAWFERIDAYFEQAGVEPRPRREGAQ